MVLSYGCMGMGLTLFGGGDEMDETMLTSSYFFFSYFPPFFSFFNCLKWETTIWYGIGMERASTMTNYRFNGIGYYTR